MPPLYPPEDLNRYRLELRALSSSELREQEEFYAWELAELATTSDLTYPEASRSFVRFKLTELQRERRRREELRDQPGAPGWAWPDQGWSDQEAWAEIKRRVPLKQLIEYAAPGVVWHKRGQTLVCSCPLGIHRDRDPSFTLYPDHFHCYGCGIGGDLFIFAQTIWQLTRRQAFTLLAEYAGLPKPTVPRARLSISKRRSIIDGGAPGPARSS